MTLWPISSEAPLEESAAPEAIDALVRAELISAPALEEAGRAADAAAAEFADA